MEKIIRSNKDLGAAIRLQRKARNLRQVDVARKASDSQNMVSNAQSGPRFSCMNCAFAVRYPGKRSCYLDSPTWCIIANERKRQSIRDGK